MTSSITGQRLSEKQQAYSTGFNQTELNEGIITELCEGLKEPMKDSKTPKDRLPSEDIAIPRPEGTKRGNNDTEVKRELESWIVLKDELQSGNIYMHIKHL